jgi:hypothetical protein
MGRKNKVIVGHGELENGRCPFCDAKDRTVVMGPVITCTVCWCSIDAALVVNWA